MKIAILGYGLQGKSAYDYWNNSENQITVCDQNTAVELPTNVEKRLGPDHLKNLGGFDLIVRSPMVHPKDIVAANTSEILEKVTTVTNEFIKACPTRNIIGVTGTKGKGTTSTLISKMLEAAGKRVHLGGNIGTPPLDLLQPGIQSEDWVVLELANFQLIDLKTSPRIAVCLMVVPEHMDWHKDMDEYVTAKQQMFAHQAAEDYAIFYGLNDTSKQIADVSPGHKLPYMQQPGAEVVDEAIKIDGQTICKTDELKLLGKHNWQNACAALTAFWQVEKNVEAARKVLISFSSLPFRIELRREVNGVKFYNDSFASAPDASIAAMEAIPENKVMIIGGFERGLDLREIAEYLTSHNENIRKVVLIGATADRIADNLKRSGFENFEFCREKSMEAIVTVAQKYAKTGDGIVLSPGFASFDMFKNFEDRGIQFNDAVEKL
ncbi:MAG TPA: UDP-N-acetylmuramoyl-L-alanine--D-glutamate ligase [Candidatus Saccharimonadales bacterium]|nr:UDP-N-acetylmuramoyl-L-alanine--D-glutamate ligase [Candidatus Saccharimonadales bacterium]